MHATGSRFAVVLAVAAVSLAGCHRPIARLDQLSRVDAAVLTDASSLGGGANASPGGSIAVTDPDRLAALDQFLTKRQGKWKKVDGKPRPTRFQLELMAGGSPLYTLWLDPGYVMMASGKSVQDARLSNAETAELLSCLGLPSNYLSPGGTPAYPAGPQAMPYGAAPQQGVVPTSAESVGQQGSARL